MEARTETKRINISGLSPTPQNIDYRKSLDRFWISEDLSDEDDPFDCSSIDCQVRLQEGGIIYVSHCGSGARSILSAEVDWRTFQKRFREFVSVLKEEQEKQKENNETS